MSSDNSSVVASDKRKPDSSDTALLPKKKRQRQTIINDPAAIRFLEGLGLDRKFLNCGTILAWGLPPNDPDFSRIEQYFETGMARKRGHWKPTIQSILRIIPSVHTFQDADIPMDFQNGMNRMMLWHGTKRRFLKSIMENGLKLPKRSGKFGAGIYFADNVHKSYFFTDWAGDQYFLLCDVYLGNIYKTTSLLFSRYCQAPSINLSPWWKIWGEQKLVPCQSVMWDTGNAPCSSGNVTVDGCTWPLGKVPTDVFSAINEFVVYNVNQVRPKFLVKAKVTYSP